MDDQTNSTTTNEIPKYGAKPKRPGLYLGLFHGRREAREKMTDWGFNGPAIGPLRWCHTTYAHDIKIEFEEAENAIDYFGVEENQFDLEVDGDMLIYQGMYFGDWTVYYVGPDECARPSDTFRQTSRVNSHLAHRKFLL